MRHRFRIAPVLAMVLTATATDVGNAQSNDAASMAAADFDRRCSQPGVVRCVGFDGPAAVQGREGQQTGITIGATTPTLDTRVKASGASSLKFTIPSRSAANTSGSYFANFSDDLSIQFGEKEEFFVQWRQRFSRELLSAHYKGGGGWKSIVVGTGDQAKQPYASCTALTVVMQSYYHTGFPVLYNSCTGSSSHGPYDGFYEPVSGARGPDFKLQNARPSPHCLYTQKQSSYFPPEGNCFRFFADEWMTFQLGIKTGSRVNDEFVGSRVRLWIARENQPSELVVDWGPYNLTAGNTSENQRFGKIWLLPYNTGKDPSEEHPVAHVWYDELIISRSKIADPGAPRPAAGR